LFTYVFIHVTYINIFGLPLYLPAVEYTYVNDSSFFLTNFCNFLFLGADLVF
jgi:hypothetical protein